MMLGFKRQFEKFVENGTKRHTIRDKGSRRWRVGMIADCFVNPRQKTMRCLGRWPVLKIDDVQIKILPMAEWIRKGPAVITAGVWINDERISLDECNALAWADGFRGNGRDGAFVQMLGFWRGRLPFLGDMIHWDYDRPVGKPKERDIRRSKAGRPRKVTR